MVGIDVGPKRLHEDHERARRLADALTELGLAVVAPETNIVFVERSDPWTTIEQLREYDVLATMVAGKVRMLTHVDVGDADIDAAIDAWRRVVSS